MEPFRPKKVLLWHREATFLRGYIILTEIQLKKNVDSNWPII